MSLTDPGPGGVSAVRGRSPLGRRQRNLIFVGLVLFVGLLAAIAMLGPSHKKPVTTTERTVSAGMPFSQQQETIPAVQPAVATKLPTMAVPQVPTLAAAQAVKDNALHAKMFGEGGGSTYNGPMSGTQPAAFARGPQEREDEFTASMTASGVGAPARAHRMKHPELMVPAGIVIPCILQTAINSELLGFVDCNLPSEVRSAEGDVALMDKGTQIMGQVRSGLRRGQNRLFILWTRARTPENVTVDLASPAADELGRAGVGCNNGNDCVNTHFAQMFWHSLLFSVIEYGPQMATAAIQNQNHGSTSFNNYTTFLQPQQQMANTILQEDLKIPPTLEKNQGDVVSIFIARDLDFSSVYDLQMTRGVASTCENCPVSTWTTERDLARNR